MNLPTTTAYQIAPMDGDAIAKVYQLEEYLSQFPQVEIETSHVFHAGVYLRTVRIPAGIVVTGAFIQVPTTLIVSGVGHVFVGDQTLELSGYHVIPSAAGRKVAFLAIEDTDVTMLFQTKASSIEEAEEEFTNEAHRLQSRRQWPDSANPHEVASCQAQS